jgi:hypothetical protein
VAFAAALVVGFVVGNPTTTILLRALLTMLLCWPVGYAVGSVAQRVNEAAIDEYKRKHPLTDPAESAPQVNAESAANTPPAPEQGKPVDQEVTPRRGAAA